MSTQRLAFSAALLIATGAVCAQAYGELDMGNVRARFYAHGLVGLDPASDQSAFEVPKNTGTFPLYSAGLWIDGTSPGNQQHLAAMMYEAGNEADYYTGPLTVDGSASTTEDVMSAFDHVWVVTRDEISLHLAYFACLSDPDCEVAVEFPDGYTIPPSFYDWPAINPTPGYDPYLGPFMDMNLDGDYNPADGDAPCIMGDQAAFFVFNDKGGPHLLSGGLPMGLEIRAMPFVFNGDSPALDQTVFIHYRIINRGSINLSDAHIGFFMDPDLGCPEDDMIGGDPARNLIYAYNGDEQDEDCLGTEGYGSQPPAFGMALLRGPYMDYNSLDDAVEDAMPAWNGQRFGDTVVDNELLGLSRAMYFLRDGDPAMTGPTTAGHFMSYLRGQWKDGTPLTYGGDGHGGTTETLFAFPDDTDPLGVGVNGNPQAAWSEVNAGNVPGDRRALASMGPLTIAPGDYNDLFIALVYARAPQGGASASIAALQQRVDSVRNFLFNNSYWGQIDFTNSFREDPLCMTNYATTSVPEHHIAGLHLFPNPAPDQVQLAASVLMAGETLILHDATGRIVRTQRVVSGLNTLDVTSLAKGVYTCTITSANARYTGRLVKE